MKTKASNQIYKKTRQWLGRLLDAIEAENRIGGAMACQVMAKLLQQYLQGESRMRAARDVKRIEMELATKKAKAKAEAALQEPKEGDRS